jgi:hypothetical protein
VKRWAIAVGVIVGLAALLLLRGRHARSPVTKQVPAARETEPWVILIEDRTCPGMAAELQRRGIAVAVLPALDGGDDHLIDERSADAAREVEALAKSLNLARAPMLAGNASGASLAALLALDTRFDLSHKLAGVIALNGTYDTAIRYARADAPSFLILSGHAERPRHAQEARTFARALERAGAHGVRNYHVASRDETALCDLAGEHNDIADLLVSFVRGEPAPGGPESAWAVSDAWSARAPISTEPFWSDARLVVRRPIDDHFRAHLGRIFASSMRELDPWPRQTYDAIDLGEYLAAHPEMGGGPFLEVTNVRGERLVLTRDEIRETKPVIVVGIDDERNLFRLLVTYNVYRSYTFKPETEPRPLLARPVGAFLHLPNGSDVAPRVVTFADFALTTSSFRLLADDPLAAVRALPKPLERVLTAEQGCLQCHSLRGAGSRSHHIRAVDGKAIGGEALAFEDYPREVLRRFLFEQDQVAEVFGVSPIRLEKSSAALLFRELTR